MQKNPEYKQPVNPPMPEMHYEDEISLIDLWLIIMRRKTLVIAVFLFCTVTGLIFALIKPVIFNFTTIIDIGSNENGKPFESLGTVQVKLKEILIPEIRALPSGDGNAVDSKLKIDVSIPKEAIAIRLETKGKEDDYNKIASLHGVVVEQLKQQYKDYIRNARNRLEDNLQRTDKQIDNLNAKSSSPASDKLSIELLMLMNRNTSSISNLELSRQDIVEQLTKLKEPRSFLSTTRSINPLGIGKAIIIVLASILGFFLGLFAAFFAEFLAKVKLRESVR